MTYLCCMHRVVILLLAILLQYAAPAQFEQCLELRYGEKELFDRTEAV